MNLHGRQRGGYTQGEEDARRVPEEAVAETNAATARAEGSESAGKNFNPNSALTLSTRFLNRTDPLWKNSENIKPIEGYQDIVCHGDTSGFAYKDLDGNEISITAREFAKILKNSPVYEGRPIRLISCRAGADSSFTAQYVANYLGVDVLAPTDTVFVLPDGEMFVDHHFLRELAVGEFLDRKERMNRNGEYND